MTVLRPAATGIDVLPRPAPGRVPAETCGTVRVQMVDTSLIHRRHRNDGGIDHPRRRTTTGRISGTGLGNRNGTCMTEGVILHLRGGFQGVPVQYLAIGEGVHPHLQSHDLARITIALRRIEVGVVLVLGTAPVVHDDLRRAIGGIRGAPADHVRPAILHRKRSISRKKSPTPASLPN